VARDQPTSVWSTFDPGKTLADEPGADRFALLRLVTSPPGPTLSLSPTDGEIAARLSERFTDVRVREVDGAADCLANPIDGVKAHQIATALLPYTLERCANPWLLLRNLRPLLTPDAAVIASVSNLRNIWTLTDLAKGTFRYAR